jgi:HK97 gp10 family phage protein
MADNFKSYKDNVIKAIKNAEKLALAEMGFLVEAEAKLRCTVDTGTLKRSITNVVDDNEKSVIIGTNVEYAPYVELGTSNQKAKPFLLPSVEENKDKLKSIVEKHLKDEVK